MGFEAIEYRWITRRSHLSGKTRKMLLSAPPTHWEAFDRGGVLIQHALPGLSKQEREFIMTGITPEEWDAAFKEDE